MESVLEMRRMSPTRISMAIQSKKDKKNVIAMPCILGGGGDGGFTQHLLWIAE